MTYRSYVICTSPRSGSTLLCSLLRATGVAGAPGSHFHEPSLDAWAADHAVTRAEGQSDLDLLKAVMAAAIAEGQGGTPVFGLRLQRHSFGYFTRQLALLFPQVGSDAARMQTAFGPTLFIHLTRADKVGQAVSYVKAEQTGLWHRAPDGTELERLAPPAEPAYDGDALRRTHDLFMDYDRDWRAWFAAEGLTPLTLTYDALSADPRAALARILDALGLDPVIAQDIDPGTAKLADATSRDWAARLTADLAAGG